MNRADAGDVTKESVARSIAVPSSSRRVHLPAAITPLSKSSQKNGAGDIAAHGNAVPACAASSSRAARASGCSSMLVPKGAHATVPARHGIAKSQRILVCYETRIPAQAAAPRRARADPSPNGRATSSSRAEDSMRPCRARCLAAHDAVRDGAARRSNDRLRCTTAIADRGRRRARREAHLRVLGPTAAHSRT